MFFDLKQGFETVGSVLKGSLNLVLQRLESIPFVPLFFLLQQTAQNPLLTSKVLTLHSYVTRIVGTGFQVLRFPQFPKP